MSVCDVICVISRLLSVSEELCLYDSEILLWFLLATVPCLYPWRSVSCCLDKMMISTALLALCWCSIELSH